MDQCQAAGYGASLSANSDWLRITTHFVAGGAADHRERLIPRSALTGVGLRGTTPGRTGQLLLGTAEGKVVIHFTEEQASQMSQMVGFLLLCGIASVPPDTIDQEPGLADDAAHFPNLPVLGAAPAANPPPQAAVPRHRTKPAPSTGGKAVGCLGVIITTFLVAAACVALTDETEGGKYGKPLPAEIFSVLPVNPATASVNASVRNTNDFPVGARCTVAAQDVGGGYHGVDVLTLTEPLSPGEERKVPFRIVITNDGAAFVTEANSTVECVSTPPDKATP